jgi:hypothetical protein
LLLFASYGKIYIKPVFNNFMMLKESLDKMVSEIDKKINSLTDKLSLIGGSLLIGGLAGAVARFQDSNTNSFSSLTTYALLTTALYGMTMVGSNKFFKDEAIRKREALLNNLAAYSSLYAGMFGAYLVI